MIALIPHILRTPDITALDLQQVSAGTDQTVKLTFSVSFAGAPPAKPQPFLIEACKRLITADRSRAFEDRRRAVIDAQEL